MPILNLICLKNSKNVVFASSVQTQSVIWFGRHRYPRITPYLMVLGRCLVFKTINFGSLHSGKGSERDCCTGRVYWGLALCLKREVGLRKFGGLSSRKARLLLHSSVVLLGYSCSPDWNLILNFIPNAVLWLVFPLMSWPAENKHCQMCFQLSEEN